MSGPERHLDAVMPSDAAEFRRLAETGEAERRLQARVLGALLSVGEHVDGFGKQLATVADPSDRARLARS